MTPLALVLAAAAHAGDGPVQAELHADLKSFFVASMPYDDPLLFPDGATGTGIVDGRAKLAVEVGDHVRLDVHHAVSAISGAQAALGGFGTGVALTAPEAVDLSWTAFDEGALTVQGRTDRLVLTTSVPSLDVAVGRQPISFGAGLMFTPLDLVNPFTPATIDSEYKPGVDAVRVDAYAGTSGKVTAAAAYAGSWDLDGTVFAVASQLTVGVTDLGLFLGEVHADEVVGVSVNSSVGAVGLYGDAALTLPADGGDPFVRAVAGTMVLPTPKTTVNAEVYVQTFGETDPAQYAQAFLDPRFARGEVWLLGVPYVGLAVSQEITPLVQASVSAISNVADPSALLVGGVGVSVSDDVAVALGVYYGLGERPGDIDLTTGTLPLGSEFGLYPAAAYVQMKAYF